MENIMVDAVDWSWCDAPLSALGPPREGLKRPRRESPPLPGPSSGPKIILRGSNSGRDDRTRLPSERSFGSHSSIIAPPSHRPAYVPISPDQTLNPSSSRSNAVPPPRGFLRRLNGSPFAVTAARHSASSSPSSPLLRARLAAATAALPNPPPADTYGAQSRTSPLRRSGRLSSARDRSSSPSSASSDDDSSIDRPSRRIPPLQQRQSGAVESGPSIGRQIRSSLRSAGPAGGVRDGSPSAELADEDEDEAEFSDLVSEDGSEDSVGTESSMEWEEDRELECAEADIAGSESDFGDFSTGRGSTSILDLPLRAVDAKFQGLNRKLGRLQGVQKKARSARSRARRLEDHLSAERYTLALYRRLLRMTQTELSETKTARKGVEGLNRALMSTRDAEVRKLESSQMEAASLKREKQKAVHRAELEKEEGRAERERLVAALQLAERAREAREKEREATARLVADRYATVSNEKEAVERRRDALEVELRDAQNAKAEGDRKLAMIREAHDFERTSYLDQIRALKDQLKVKVERSG